MIVLKRLGEHEGSTISITVLNAPAKARKAYAGGAAAMRQRKWTQARKRFEEATALYPKYALAWSELGVALERQGRLQEAADACRKATAADPLYIKPHEQLARLAAKQGQWAETLEAVQRALPLNPVEFPGLFFYQALACSNLGRLAEMESSARRAIDLDSGSEFPRSYLLLGSALAQRGSPAPALEALRTYVARSPRAPEVPAVNQWILKLQSAPPGKP